MTLSTAASAKIGKAVGIAIATAIAGSVGAHVGTTVSAEKLDQLILKVDTLQSDVRLLKCAARFPGDCPGQASR